MEEATWTGPAYRIQTRRLTLRPWSPEDAPALEAAYTPETLAHLSAWIGWAANEPTTRAQKVARLRKMRGRFDLDEHYVYAAFDPGGELVGGVELSPAAGEAALELGYWVRAERSGQGLATEMSEALVWAAFRWHRARRVEVRCDPRNLASAAIPRRLGFTHEGTRRQTFEDAAGALRDSMIWTLMGSEFEDGALANRAPRAWDVTGAEATPGGRA